MAKPFSVAMREYFGLNGGQKLPDFASELKCLSYEEKLDFHAMLVQADVDCDPPANSASQ